MYNTNLVGQLETDLVHITVATNTMQIIFEQTSKITKYQTCAIFANVHFSDFLEYLTLWFREKNIKLSFNVDYLVQFLRWINK